MDKIVASIGILGFIAICIIVVALAFVSIWATILQWSVFWRYQKNNRRKIEGGKTARQTAVGRPFQNTRT